MRIFTLVIFALVLGAGQASAWEDSRLHRTSKVG
jgi:hypothetical protein